MKKLYMRFLIASLAAVVGLASCVEEEAPEVSLVLKESRTQNLPSASGSFTRTILSNDDWTVTIPEEAASWLTVDVTRGKGNATITFNYEANPEEYHTTTVKITNGLTMIELLVRQTGDISTEVLYAETFGAGVSKTFGPEGDRWPLVNEYAVAGLAWGTSGTGSANVKYSNEGASEVQRETNSEGYKNASGSNNVRLGQTAGNTLEIHGISTQNAMSFDISFGLCSSAGVTLDFSYDQGATWEPVTLSAYATPNEWAVVSGLMVTPDQRSELWVRFTSAATSHGAMLDDISISVKRYTDASLPILTAYPVLISNVKPTSAVVYAKYEIKDPSMTVSTYGVRWKKRSAAEYDPADFHEQHPATDPNLEFEILNLEEDTEYVFMTYIVASTRGVPSTYSSVEQMFAPTINPQQCIWYEDGGSLNAGSAPGKSVEVMNAGQSGSLSWNKQGTSKATVTYEGNSLIGIVSSLPASQFTVQGDKVATMCYPFASGGNAIMFKAPERPEGAKPTFTVKGIDVSTKSSVTLLFGMSKWKYEANQNVFDPTFSPAAVTLEYCVDGVGTEWLPAHYTYSVPESPNTKTFFRSRVVIDVEGATTLWLRWICNDFTSSNYKIDDIKLFEGGTVVLHSEPSVYTGSEVAAQTTSYTAIIEGNRIVAGTSPVLFAGVEYRLRGTSNAWIAVSSNDISQSHYSVHLGLSHLLIPFSDYEFRAYASTSEGTYVSPSIGYFKTKGLPENMVWHTSLGGISDIVATPVDILHYSKWMNNGDGGKDVIYEGTTGVTVRSYTNSVGSNGYEGASGYNCVFLTAGTLVAKDILVHNLSKATVTFGASASGFDASQFLLHVSFDDGLTWETVPYARVACQTGTWGLCTASITIPADVMNMNMAWEATGTGYRLDDITLYSEDHLSVITRPVVTTAVLAEADIDYNDASFKGTITPGNTTLLTYGFEMKVTKGGKWSTTPPDVAGTLVAGELSATAENLRMGVGYSVRAFATATGFRSRIYGEERTFKTLTDFRPLPSVTSYSDDFSSVTTDGQQYGNLDWESFNSDGNPFNGWKTHFTSSPALKCYQCTGAGSAEVEVEAYTLLRSPLNVKNATSQILCFRSAFAGTVADGTSLKLVATTEFEGDFGGTTWTEIADVSMNPLSHTASKWTYNVVDLSAFSESDNLFICFKYEGKALAYYIDDVAFGTQPLPFTWGTPYIVDASGLNVDTNLPSNFPTQYPAKTLKIRVPYSNNPGAVTYSNVGVTQSGVAGLNDVSPETVTTGRYADGELEFEITGKPTVSGTATFSINGLTGLVNNTVTATVGNKFSLTWIMAPQPSVAAGILSYVCPFLPAVVGPATILDANKLRYVVPSGTVTTFAGAATPQAWGGQWPIAGSNAGYTYAFGDDMTNNEPKLKNMPGGYAIVGFSSPKQLILSNIWFNYRRNGGNAPARLAVLYKVGGEYNDYNSYNIIYKTTADIVATVNNNGTVFDIPLAAPVTIPANTVIWIKFSLYKAGANNGLTYFNSNYNNPTNNNYDPSLTPQPAIIISGTVVE